MFLLSQNCRQPLKHIAKTLRQSEQTTSYQIKRLIETNEITPYSLIDYAILGFTNVLMGFTVKSYSKERLEKAQNILTNHEDSLFISRTEDVVDFVVEFKARNLSHFNKQHVSFIQKHGEIIKTKFVYPIIVRHSYPRNYLAKKKVTEDIITLGDRDVISIKPEQQIVLDLLEKHPRLPILEISKQTGFGMKRIVTIRKFLEKENIIRKYACLLHAKEIDAKLIFVRLANEIEEQSGKMVEFAQQHPNCVELIKLIGEYGLLFKIESIDKMTFLEDLRSMFEVEQFVVLPVSFTERA